MPLARLRGVVEEKGDDWAIVALGGAGLLASVPANTAAALAVGEPASLFTYLHVREDALTLYGFATREDLTLFELLIGVSGIGPRAALGLLSALDYRQLATAIASGQTEILRRVPGIGQKTAERLVLELRDKVVPPPPEDGVRPAQPPAGRDEEVIAALVGLGYSQIESAAAAGAVPDQGIPLEERIRVALGYFARV